MQQGDGVGRFTPQRPLPTQALTWSPALPNSGIMKPASLCPILGQTLDRNLGLLGTSPRSSHPKPLPAQVRPQILTHGLQPHLPHAPSFWSPPLPPAVGGHPLSPTFHRAAPTLRKVLP